jgi:hypothetical protein
MIFDIFSTREPDWVREQIDPAMRSGQPPLVAAAMRAIRNLRERALLDYVTVAAQSDDLGVRIEAMLTGLSFAVKAAWDECRIFAGGMGELSRLALGLLATSPDPKDRALVRGKALEADAGTHALWALGFAGDADSADILVQAMADEKKSKIAGEAFSAITGLAIAGQMAKPGETQGPDVPEVADDEPPPVVGPEDGLPEPRCRAGGKMVEQRTPALRSGDALCERPTAQPGHPAQCLPGRGQLAARDPAHRARGRGGQPAARKSAQSGPEGLGARATKADGAIQGCAARGSQGRDNGLGAVSDGAPARDERDTVCLRGALPRGRGVSSAGRAGAQGDLHLRTRRTLPACR